MALSGRSFLRSTDGDRTARIAVFVFGVLIVAAGSVEAWTRHWLGDDIFITFRYIDQWFVGNGLVYNVGERVEGYTHPLWLLVLAVWKWLGGELTTGAWLLGVVSFSALLVSICYASFRLSRRPWFAFSSAALALVLHHDMLVWATGGLETSLFTLLVTLTVLVPTLLHVSADKKAVATGALLTLGVLTRPDGVVIAPVVAGYMLFEARAGGKAVHELRRLAILIAAPAVIVLAPYAVWKLAYYGDLLPNTYYAKSGGGSYFRQGFTYIGYYLDAYPSTWLLLIGPLAMWKLLPRAKDVRKRMQSLLEDERAKVLVLGGLVILVYGIMFVARVGGDFMFSRFLIPLVPLVLLLIETSFRVLLEHRSMALAVPLIGFPLLVGTVDQNRRAQLFLDEQGKHVTAEERSGIMDEHWFWTRPFTEDSTSLIDATLDVGKELETYFREVHVRLLIRGQAGMAFYSRASEVIENWGLTDSYIAHQQIGERRRIGHEKFAPVEYLIGRRVHFFFYHGAYQPHDTSFYRFVSFRLPHGWGPAEMYVYDRTLMRELKRRFPGRVKFVDFEAYLEYYLSTAKYRSRREVERDFQDFRVFYFYHNADADREQKFLDALAEKGIGGREKD
ncbi:MAG: hypothetical protein A3H45_13210 [Ignavibacteria bacterium RIFCSPLOWO2_02_FULL_55_14]|nr:MAG: hypothetical protein A3H45_13210 [Ignavibacteria bacterium RIFCSPLOWO2_02_FULL_55_14]